MNKAKPQRSMSLSQQLDQLPGETDVPACDLSNEKLEKTFFFFFFFLKMQERVLPHVDGRRIFG